jgi:hypothetical protein
LQCQISKPNSTELTIPLDNKVLGNFIASLLGQSRTIERRFSDRRFEIDVAWLLNLDQIINQRLASQNQGELVSFSARFYFGNGKVIILEDHAAFRAFHDLSNELSVGADLRWTYLIKFPLAKLPEKQEIRFSVFTDKNIAEQKAPEKKKETLFNFGNNENEEISTSVHFTDVTWGEDLYSHIGNYILAKTEDVPKWKSFLLSLRSTSLFSLSAFGGMSIAMWSVYSGITDGLNKITQRFGDLNTLKLNTIDEKLDLLISFGVTRMNTETFPISSMLRSLIFFIAVVGTYFLLTSRKASFININDFSDRHLKKYLSSYEFVRYGVFFALTIGIVGGLFSNRLYDLSKGLW